MRAIRSFVASLDGEPRRFSRGEKIPDEWVPSINAQSVVDEPLVHLGAGAVMAPFPEFQDLKTVEDVMGWVAEPDDYELRARRADHALGAELAGRNRKTLLEFLGQYIEASV